MIQRRSFLAALSAIVAMTPQWAKAQFTEQEVRNGATVTSTGDVDINQSASGSQVVDVNGVPITGDGVYATDTGQVVVNDGRVVSTGDVSINQSASASQSVSAVYPEYAGQVADYCSVGTVLANPWTGQVYYQGEDCCWYPACADRCKSCDTCG